MYCGEAVGEVFMVSKSATKLSDLYLAIDIILNGSREFMLGTIHIELVSH